jgi:2-polyprenyl-3-methyl-5-hydroxy-6-metoxy-1,4-benzoquinol methylase
MSQQTHSDRSMSSSIEGAPTTPTADAQSRYWTKWVEDSLAWESNPDNARRADCVIGAVEVAARPPARVLDVGCGTGWVSLRLAERGYRVTGTDLASDAMKNLERTRSEVRWVGGDFAQVDVGTDYDVVTCMETIAHVPDQEAFAKRLIDVLRPGGSLVLTTQNPYVWNRTSWLKPPGAGQLRNWPSGKRLKELFGTYFAIERMTTCAPGGDVGWLRLVHNGITRRVAEFVIARDGWRNLRERAFLGRSILLVAHKR